MAEAQPGAVGAVAVRRKHGAVVVADPLLEGLLLQSCQVYPLGHFQPDVQPAFGLDPPGRVTEILTQRRQHRVPLGPQRVVLLVDVFVHVVAQVLFHRQRGELVYPAAALEAHRPLPHFRGRHQVAQPHAGSDDFGERPHVKHLPGVVHRVDGSYVLAFEPQVNVAIVFQDGDTPIAGDVQHPAAAFQGHGPAHWVLEGRNGVQVLDPLALPLGLGDGLFQRFWDYPVVVALDAPHVGAEQPHLAQGAEVDKLLGKHHVAGVGEGLNNHGYALAGAGGQHNVFYVHRHVAVPQQLLGHQLTQ